MNEPSKPRKAVLVGGAVGMLAAGAIGGAVLAGTTAANAAVSTVDTTSGYSSNASGEAANGQPEHGTAAHENLEKAVTGASATKAQTAAVRSVGSGTAGAVTTDVTGKGYEVTVTKSDGSKVEVHLNSSFSVTEPGHTGR
jgi:nicotinic acid phosphoribosyltransferase